MRLGRILKRRKRTVKAFRIEDNLPSSSKLVRKYGDIRISLADACLVRMSELESSSVLLTLDADFLIYRRHGRQAIPILAPTNK